MASRAICVALLSCLLIAGCGTVANVTKPAPAAAGGKTPFGGVRHDVSCIKQAAGGDCDVSTPPKPQSEQLRQAALTLFWAVDLPFSLIGDVVTWPYVTAYSFINDPIPVPPVPAVPDIGRPQAPLKPEKPDPDTKPDTKTPAKDGGQGKQMDGNPPPMPMNLPRPKKENP